MAELKKYLNERDLREVWDVINGQNSLIVSKIKDIQKRTTVGLYANSTSSWKENESKISEAGALYIYTDAETFNGKVIAKVKIGDGTSSLADLSFIDAPYSAHIADKDIHFTAEERAQWNDEISAFVTAAGVSADTAEQAANRSETAAQTAQTAADSTTADRQAVQTLATQVTADKATVADHAAQVAEDRTAAETAAQAAQSIADSLPDDYMTAVGKIAENTTEINNTNNNVSQLKEDLATYIKTEKSENILNPDNISDGYWTYDTNADGTYTIRNSRNKDYKCAFIDVDILKKYIITGISLDPYCVTKDGIIRSYAINKNIGTTDTPNVILDPSLNVGGWGGTGEVTRIYFAWRPNVFPNIMVVEGETLPNEYIPYKNIIELNKEIDVDYSQIKNMPEIQGKNLVDAIKSLIEIKKVITLPVAFNNSYIDTTSKKIASYDGWVVRAVALKKGDKIITQINGTFCCLATCMDETPTIESVFDIIFHTTTQSGYSIEYTAEKDETLYLSSSISYGATGEIYTTKIINVNDIDEKVNVLDIKINEFTKDNKSGAVGYSLDYNRAFETIEELQYDGENPWTKFENTDDFEEYGTYIDNKISSIPDGNSFIFITDVHYTGNKKHSGALLDYVRRKANIKTIIHGGDVQNERPYAIDAAKDWFAFNKDYVGRIGSDFKQVCGDHDHNGQYWGKESLREQYGLTDPSKTFFTCKFVQKVLTGYCENEIVYDTVYDDVVNTYGWDEEDLKEYNAFKKMHYYFDDDKAKTRFIVLFTGWSWADYGFPYNKSGNTSIIVTQTRFLYNSLITLPNGYNVVVLGHDTIINPLKEVIDGSQYYDTNDTVFNGNGWKQVVNMLTGFKKKNTVSIKESDWSIPYSSVDVVPSVAFDFSNAPNANVIMTVGGDVHWDIMSKTTLSSTSTLETLRSGDTIDLSTDIPHIVTMTDGGDRGYRDYATREPICRPNTKGTIDEQAFDVITINSNGIFFTRIGSGDDRKLLFENENAN